MKVTIAIINYNYGRFLKQAIDSAINQTTTCDYEILIIDDGSTDNSHEVMAEYAGVKNFRISKTENQGFAKSLCRAVQEARGKYLFLMDADDYFYTNKLESILPHFYNGFLYIADTSTYFGDVKINGGASGSTSTIAVLTDAAKCLLPLENELSFYTFFKLGKGLILKESYTYYRYHTNSMTNRNIPGKWQNYLAGITFNLADKLYLIYTNHTLKKWVENNESVLYTSYYFKSQAYYNKLEEKLETRKYFKAYKYCFLMLFWAIRSRDLSILNFKMLAKTLIGKPSFPKNNKF